MRIAACFDILWIAGALVLAMSPHRCDGQSVNESTDQLTCRVDYGRLVQSGHLLLKGDVLHIEAKAKPGDLISVG
jgi:hypothetical protein